MPKIVVLGGVVMDLVFLVQRLPDWKQAVQAFEFGMWPGGKGLNQAVAASKLGAQVSIISAVGQDDFGKKIMETLDGHQIDNELVLQASDEPTAVTNVFVNYQADASFVGWKSVTKSKVDRALVLRAETQIKSADAILITLEVSLSAVEEAVNIAKRHGLLIVLNPAPPLDPPERLTAAVLKDISVLVPNQWEAAQLISGPRGQSDPAGLALLLHRMGARIACVTTSEAGCVVATNEGVTDYPSFECIPKDTTGASDAFCAALAIALAEGKPLETAIERANAAGAIAVGKLGGYPSLPDAEELETFLKRGKRTGPIRKLKKRSP